MKFLDRALERRRLSAAFARPVGTLCVLYGRRRCGKSRLLREALGARSVTAASFVGDDREASLQRQALASEMARVLPGFGDAVYPDWEPLLNRWFKDAPRGSVLALDEFPSLVAASPELPSLLQKQIDAGPRSHVVLAGSSQNMMHGLTLDRTAPLFGRAREVLKIQPLPAGWLLEACPHLTPIDAVEAFSVFGGVPRYWELFSDFPRLPEAVEELILNPLGVLHEEPPAVLLDDFRELAQATTLLALIGSGCHRVSEIAGRIGKPATSLSRPLARLADLGLVSREVPFGSRSGDKRTLYRIADPFLSFWFRFVEPNRSRLQTARVAPVVAEVKRDFPHHAAAAWEALSRASVAEIGAPRVAWEEARRYWGPGLDRNPMELDVVAESADRARLLIGESKWHDRIDWAREAEALRQKVARFPAAQGREVELMLFAKRSPGRTSGLDGIRVVTPEDVLAALR